MTLPAAVVRILVCGNAERGDDSAALAAMTQLLPHLPPDVCERIEVRRCVQLDAADLVDLRDGEAALVVDCVTGVAPGAVVSLPLADLATNPRGIVPRSSHALPVADAIALATTVRGSPPPGVFVGIGGKWFGYGTRTSRAVRGGLPLLQAAVEAEIERLLEG
jgi:hydrogenase maturation protease